MRTSAVIPLTLMLLGGPARAGKEEPTPDIGTPEGLATLAGKYQIAALTKMTDEQLEFAGGGLPKKLAVVDFKVVPNVEYAGPWTATSGDMDLKQRVTDAFYDRFVARATEAGFEVIPKETVTGAAMYQELAGSLGPKDREARADTIVPTGMLRIPFNPTNLPKFYKLEDELDAHALVGVFPHLGAAEFSKKDGGVVGEIAASQCNIGPLVAIETGYLTREMKMRDNEIQYMPAGGKIGFCNAGGVPAKFDLGFGVPPFDATTLPQFSGMDANAPDVVWASQVIGAWDATLRIGFAALKTRFADTQGKK